MKEQQKSSRSIDLFTDPSKLSELFGMETRELYEKLIFTSPDGIILTDLHGRIIYASPSTSEIFNLTESEVLGTSVFEWIDEIHVAKAQEHLKKVLEGKSSRDNQYLLKKKDGQTYWGAINAAPITNKNGLTVGMIGVVRDITYQKHAEEELRQNEIRYRLLFETAHDSIFLMDEDVFIDCNPKTLATFGCTKKDIIGKSPQLFSPPVQPDGSDSTLSARKKIQAALRGQNQIFDWKHQRLDGQLFDAEVSLNSITLEGKPYLQAIVRNVSKRKKSEGQLRKFSECLLSFGPDPGNNINLLTKLCGEILGASCALYNCLQGELICSLGQWNTPPDYITENNPQGHICYDVIAQNGNDIFFVKDLPGTDYFITDPNVAQFGLKTYIGKVVQLNGQAIGSLCAVFREDYIPDAADKYFVSLIASAIGVEEARKQAQDKIFEFTEELKESNIAKDKFFSIIAHDLKGPFNAIMGFSDILTSEWSDFTEEEKQHFIRNIHSSANNTFRLLENLLEWAMTQTGKFPFNPAPNDLSILVNDAVIFLREQAEKKQIKLFTAVNFGTMVMADENMIRTVFRNLLSNAIKFTHPGGQVKIFAHEVAAPHTDQKMIEVSVIDNGVGIAGDILPKLFRIDEKIRSTGTANEKGTGLGLILSRELIEKNHGRIWVESEQGNGSRFYFTLPKGMV